eukprot:gnl/Dysnectes_brevis/1261_a1411_5132.p1 GENE.gnl/Dysnectes_brevis/1261_a1411_5132~~gnl/Dysnectes_brevis/1261_a1411_5132.p1  ORF type:complete len:194 (+),score=38.34 gnl/Dysnectes_brevis/1261_a1411_5132:20-601(+)
MTLPLSIEGLYKIIPAPVFRSTSHVDFHDVPVDFQIPAISMVVHKPNAHSPGPVITEDGHHTSTWYCHPHQEDNLLVFAGSRISRLYRPGVFGDKVVSIRVTPTAVYDHNTNEVIYDGAAILSWPPMVYHQVESDEAGSTSINIPHRTDGFDIHFEFNIWEIKFCEDKKPSEPTLVREGWKDQVQKPVHKGQE